MSRIGRNPVELPANVTAEINAGNEVIVKGPKGELKQKFSNKVEIKLDGNVITVKGDNRREVSEISVNYLAVDDQLSVGSPGR